MASARLAPPSAHTAGSPPSSNPSTHYISEGLIVNWKDDRQKGSDEDIKAWEGLGAADICKAGDPSPPAQTWREKTTALSFCAESVCGAVVPCCCFDVTSKPQKMFQASLDR